MFNGYYSYWGYWCGKARVTWGVGWIECDTDTFPAPLQLRTCFEFRRQNNDKFEQNHAQHGAEHAQQVLGLCIYVYLCLLVHSVSVLPSSVRAFRLAIKVWSVVLLALIIFLFLDVWFSYCTGFESYQQIYSRSRVKGFGGETGSSQKSSMLLSRVLSRFGLIFTDIASEYLAREPPARASHEELAELDKLAGLTAMILMCWSLKSSSKQINMGQTGQSFRWLWCLQPENFKTISASVAGFLAERFGGLEISMHTLYGSITGGLVSPTNLVKNRCPTNFGTNPQTLCLANQVNRATLPYLL